MLLCYFTQVEINTMFYPRVKWTPKEATINVHGKDKMHKRFFFLCMVEREGTWTSIPFCRYQSPSKHHTKKMQGLMEFASPNLPCLCSLPIHVPEPTDRTGGTLQSNVSCQMSRSPNQKQISVSKGSTQCSHTSTSISKWHPRPSKLHAAQDHDELLRADSAFYICWWYPDIDEGRKELWHWWADLWLKLHI